MDNSQRFPKEVSHTTTNTGDLFNFLDSQDPDRTALSEKYLLLIGICSIVLVIHADARKLIVVLTRDHKQNRIIVGSRVV